MPVKGSRKLTDQQIGEAARLHAAGTPITSLAPRYQVSDVCLGRLLRQQGFYVASRQEAAARRRYCCNDHFFECIDTEEKAYWAGYITADGCLTRNRGSFVLSVSAAEVDEAHLRHL